MKKLLTVGLSATLVVGFSICSNRSTNSGGNSGGGRVALVAKANSVEYWVKVKEGVEAAGEEFGVDVSFNGPDTGPEGNKQLSQLRGAINDKPLGIGFAPQGDAQGGAPALIDRVKESGASVVIFDTPLNRSDVPTVIVASDSRSMGVQAAKKLVALTDDKDKVAAITHDEVGTAAAWRDDFKEYLARNASELQIVDMQDDESDPAKSRDRARGILQAHPDPVGFFGIDDGSTITIADKVATKNLQTKVVGADSSPDIISLLGQGKISGTVMQNPYGMGRKMIELIVAVSRGENPTEKNVVSKPVWVTTGNLEDPDVQQIVN